MTGARAARQQGFSLLELVVVIVLISVLFAVAIERLLVMKAQAERVAMEQVLSSIRSGLTIRLAEYVMRGRVQQAVGLANKNPIGVLADKPQNYLGELFGPDPSTLARGNWYFDSRDGALCYLVESDQYFETGLTPPRARFRIQPVFEDVNQNGRYDEGNDMFRGLRLAQLDSYRWKMRFVWPDWGRREGTSKANGDGGG